MNRDTRNDDAMTDNIWNIITDSAKSRFDYVALEEEFPFNPDNFLFAIIMGLALGEDKNSIALKLVSHMMMAGYMMDKDGILKMIEENEKAFGLEILATRMANDRLERGDDPFSVYVTVSQFLD